MTNLEKLEKEIRANIPRLTELSEGCIIDTPYGTAKVNNITLDEDFQDVVFICKQLQYRACPVKHITIIGHEIQLNDVLEWFRDETNIIGGSLTASFTNRLDSLRLGISGYDYYLIGDWDLSKNLLKDQSEDLIKSLSELI
jgi:hypothetical protein